MAGVRLIRALALLSSVSLDQMRRNLTLNSSQSSGPSLKETLDWLKEKVALSTSQVDFTLGEVKTGAARIVPVRFDSSIVDQIGTDTPSNELLDSVRKKFPTATLTDVKFTDTIHFTIPLSLLRDYPQC